MVFQSVCRYLKPDGIFIFDISSYYKLSSILGNNTIVRTDEDISYIWLNYFDRRSNICEMYLSFFTKEGEYYRRFDETHYQRAYKAEEIIRRLKHNGFKNIEAYQPLHSNLQRRVPSAFFSQPGKLEMNGIFPQIRIGNLKTGVNTI